MFNKTWPNITQTVKRKILRIREFINYSYIFYSFKEKTEKL